MTEKKKVVKKATKVVARVIERPRETKTTAIVMQEVQLSPRQVGVIQAETPTSMIKSKPGRGGKKVAFVEGGYVISILNQAFSPLGWEFKIVEKGETERKNESNTEGEVWVYGELTIIDHKNGYKTTKGQYGQHPIHTKVPIGDAYKAAGTDALKKCASLLGIALDVYWGILDQSKDEAPKAPDVTELMDRAKMLIRSTNSIDVLLEYREKLSAGKTFNETQKKELIAAVDARLNQLDVPTP